MEKPPTVDIEFLPGPGEHIGEGVEEVLRSYNDLIAQLRAATIKHLQAEWERQLRDVDLYFSELHHLPAQEAHARLASVPAHIPIHQFWHDAQIVWPSIATLLGVWLQARFGRKVRVKVGDIEAEARTSEEVARLLTRAQEIKQANEPKRIYEP